MITVGIRELKQHLSEIVRQVRDENQEVQVTYRGEVVARLIPVRSPSSLDEGNQEWADLDRLAVEIGASWQGTISAVEAVAEGRR